MTMILPGALRTGSLEACPTQVRRQKAAALAGHAGQGTSKNSLVPGASVGVVAHGAACFARLMGRPLRDPGEARRFALLLARFVVGSCRKPWRAPGASASAKRHRAALLLGSALLWECAPSRNHKRHSATGASAARNPLTRDSQGAEREDSGDICGTFHVAAQ